MEKKKVTSITTETHEVLVFRRLQNASIRAWCAVCSQEMEMVTPGDGTLLTGVSARTIYQWVEEGSVHFTETTDGLLLVCQKSLAETCGNRSAQQP